jgi:hypothetical protein
MKSMHDIGLSDVKAVMAAKGYKIMPEGQPNIVGIRSANRQSNSYDDTCWVWWTDNGSEIVHNYTITTNPGFYYLQHPIAGTSGTGILVPGQYIGCWMLGYHRGTQFALVQRGGPMSVYRDSNRDTVLDYDPKTIQSGFWGLDGHHGSLEDTDIVDKFSAACIVWRYHQPHEDLMQIFLGLSKKYDFDKFTFSLLQQEDFI